MRGALTQGGFLQRHLPRRAKDALRVLRRKLPAVLVAKLEVPVRRLDRPRPVSPATVAVSPALVAELPRRPEIPRQGARLLIGPANFAGQGWEWGRAAERYLSDVHVTVFQYLKGTFDFPHDYAVPLATYGSIVWQREQEEWIAENFGYVLIEAGRPVLGQHYARDCAGEVPVLQRRGVTIGMLAHGSDVRRPAAHAERYPWSPFREEGWQSTLGNLDELTSRLVPVINGFDGARFVSTLDLLDDVPGAEWLPVVVDVDRWASDAPIMEKDRPVVVHAPSNPRIKGSDLIDPVAQRLSDAGLIDYRRISGVEPAEMPTIYKHADIVLDQFRLGSYGVTACEGMAAGRVVVGHIVEPVRDRIRERTGLDLPIVEATPGDIEEVLLRLVEDRADALMAAQAGNAFVRAWHDGRMSAKALAPFLGRTWEG